MEKVILLIGCICSVLMLTHIVQDATIERQASNELLERKVDSLELDRDIWISIYENRLNALPNSDEVFGLLFSIDSTKAEFKTKLEKLKTQ